MASPIKGVPVSPLTGTLDSRSSPDLLDGLSLRFRQNFQTTADKKLNRGCGWAKLLSEVQYNNQDFHDQLLTFTDASIRQPITFLKECESTRGVRTLFAGTQGRLARLNEYGGNWKIIGDGFGGTAITSAAAKRFHGAQLLDILALTNDFDKPVYHNLETPSIDGDPLLQEFEDLELIGLTRAARIWTWRNCIFLADVEMEGQRFAYRMLWSDRKNGISFDPAKLESITGRFDLYTHERILGFAENPGANSGAIYTTHGIWEIAEVGGAAVYSFARRFNGDNKPGEAVLKFPNTLVNTPEGHIYCAEDGIYYYTGLTVEPERVEWLHKGSNLIYDGLDKTNCEVHVACIRGDEVYISMASEDATNECPDRMLRINTRYRTADFVEVGFTAFCTYRSYNVPTIRDFIIENGICTLEELTDAGYGFEEEGLPNPLPSGSPEFTPDQIRTDEAKEIDGYPEINPEDWEAEPSEFSLCTLLGDQTLDDFCRRCDGPTLLVGARSDDWCLKQIGEVFYRERCANPTATGESSDDGYSSATGSYLLDGYESIIRFAPMFVPRSSPGQPYVVLENLLLEIIAAVQTPPSEVEMRVGISGQIADPNADDDRITWFELTPQDMKLITQYTPAERKAKNIQPSDFISFASGHEGRVIHIEVKVGGTGGQSEWTTAVAEVRAKAAQNF